MKVPASGFWVLLLGISAAGLVVGPFLPAALGEPLLLFLAGLFPVLLMALGARRQVGAGRFGSGALGLGSLAPVLILLAVLLEGVLFTLWRLSGTLGEGPWALGLPAVAWIFLVGLGGAPLLLVGWSYAKTFFEQTLKADELERFDSRFPSRREP